MKKAYEYDKEIIANAVPRVLTKQEQTWEEVFNADDRLWESVKLLWGSNVPGSYAPEKVLLAGIASMEHMGYDVSEAEKLIDMALELRENNDRAGLISLTAKVFNLLNSAPKIREHKYHEFECYDSFEKIEKDVDFPIYNIIDVDSEEFYDKIYAGWKTQIIGASFGTAIEGYNTKNLRNAFGEIKGYIREPETYNDDITYEIALLSVFSKLGYELTSSDIALEWAARIPSGWSAEDIALKNIMLGIFPPESGYRSNPFREWIGAQMRGVICGMLAPANPKQAASLAFKDGVVSHYNNGVIGEVFNAVIASMAFVEKDMRALLKKAIQCIPKDSEYYSVLSFAIDTCNNCTCYEEAWKICEKKLEKYNWIHAYPNAAIEVIALYYCNNDFDTVLNMIGMMGQDVDCNAAQVATLFGLAYGSRCLTKKWLAPLPREIKTYVRGFETTSYEELTELVISGIKSWRKKN